ncbi:MAG: hypothetical protein Q7K35_01830 [bacterium]|nr:hypothetical protein [bacterium]
MADNITIDELAGIIKGEFDKVGGRFDKVEGRLGNLEREIKLRPTKTEMFGWADRRIVDLELRADRHDYLHINELEKLPPQPEISRALVERGLKEKTV